MAPLPHRRKNPLLRQISQQVGDYAISVSPNLPQGAPNRRLVVTNLPAEGGEMMLKMLFQQYSGLKEVCIVENSDRS